MVKFLHFISVSVVAILLLNPAVAEESDNNPVRANIKAARNTELKGQIQLSGAFALYPLVVKWSEEFRKIHPKVRIDISAGGAGKGITDALSGLVDLGMVSREVHESEFEKGAFVFSVAKDAVIPTINANHPSFHQVMARGLTRKAAIKLWRDGTAKTWGDVLGNSSTIPIHVYTRSDACGAADTWAAYIGVKQEDLEGTAVFGDPGIASVVQRDRVGIAYNNIAYAYDLKTKRPHKGIAVLPIDVNDNGRIDPEENFYATSTDLNKAIADGRYPSPPARKLYLVCHGKPEKPEVIEFLTYILTEGQKWAAESGFVGLSDAELIKELKKIE